VVYGIGRIDSSGRVADRAVISALGWRGGDRLTLTAGAGVVVARRDPGGLVTVPARPYIVIPAALRRRCGLRARPPTFNWPATHGLPSEPRCRYLLPRPYCLACARHRHGLVA
jgi:hypothetical protein